MQTNTLTASFVALGSSDVLSLLPATGVLSKTGMLFSSLRPAHIQSINTINKYVRSSSSTSAINKEIITNNEGFLAVDGDVVLLAASSMNTINVYTINGYVHGEGTINKEIITNYEGVLSKTGMLFSSLRPEGGRTT
jgi:hypothetical protein